MVEIMAWIFSTKHNSCRSWILRDAGLTLDRRDQKDQRQLSTRWPPGRAAEPTHQHLQFFLLHRTEASDSGSCAWEAWWKVGKACPKLQASGLGLSEIPKQTQGFLSANQGQNCWEVQLRRPDQVSLQAEQEQCSCCCFSSPCPTSPLPCAGTNVHTTCPNKFCSQSSTSAQFTAQQ